MRYLLQQRGFSLVEVVFVSAISLVIFGALFSSFKFSFELMNLSRAKLSAMSVANDRMEYFRSLSYSDVGTVSGIPSGTIPQNNVVILNGIEFQERVLVEYVDDIADGQGVSDTNGIPSDYKRLKLEYEWTIGGVTNKIFLVSNIVPRSIETTAGGGTVRVNVIDENSNLLTGASVRLINNTVGPVDVIKLTDLSGASLFSGAPAASGYEIIVTGNISGNDYSTAQTYPVTVANPNPIVSPFSVLESDISTLTFQIGELSDLTIKTLSSISEGSFNEDFSDLVSVDSSSGVSVNSGNLILFDTIGVYNTDGFVYLGPIAPSPLKSWNVVRVAPNLPSDTSFYVQFLTGLIGGPYIMIPDGDLPGNSTGFSGSIIDISDLDVSVYPSIFVGIFLETSDTSKTPSIDEINVHYRQSESVFANASLDVRGLKTIGLDALLSPIYKYSNTLVSDANGDLLIANLEFDTYNIEPSGSYDIASACNNYPIAHKAGIDSVFEAVLVADVTNTLRVTIVDVLGRSIPGVEVTASRSGFTSTETTNNCGQTFYNSGLSVNSDYVIDSIAPGYIDENVTSFEISADTITTIVMTQ